VIKNIPPVGDGLWHIYDIRNDPGETKDLQSQMPDVFIAMQADYAAYAKANGVLAMPGDYDPIQQVLINAMINVYLPRLKSAALPTATGLVLLVATFMLFRRRRRMQAP